MSPARISYLSLTLLFLGGNIADAFSPSSYLGGKAAPSMSSMKMATNGPCDDMDSIAGIVGAFGVAAAVLTSGAGTAEASVIPPPAQGIVGKLCIGPTQTLLWCMFLL